MPSFHYNNVLFSGFKSLSVVNCCATFGRSVHFRLPAAPSSSTVEKEASGLLNSVREFVRASSSSQETTPKTRHSVVYTLAELGRSDRVVCAASFVTATFKCKSFSRVRCALISAWYGQCHRCVHCATTSSYPVHTLNTIDVGT